MTAPESIPHHAVIAASGIGVAYGVAAALRSVSLEVFEGERVLIQGHNGAGKSTFIRVLAGLQRPDRGNLTIAGGSPYSTDIRRLLGVVVHAAWLDGEFTVLESLRFFAALYQVQGSDSRINDLLDLLGMAERRHQRVSELSRGFLQRLTLARALVHDPAILLLDEPDTGLDEQSLASLHRAIIVPSIRGSRTVVLTSHNRAFGESVATRVITMEQGAIITRPPAGVASCEPSGVEREQVSQS